MSNYPKFPEFREYIKFFEGHHFKGDGQEFTATKAWRNWIRYEARRDRPGIQCHVTAEGVTTVTDITEKSIEVHSLDDFKWKLFCILKKTGKL